MGNKLFVVFLILLSLIGCQQNERDGASIQQLEEISNEPNKKVILVIIDSMKGSLVDAGLEKGTIPALEFLVENGQYYKDLVAPYPSMSTVIESTLATGKMPHEHGIAGLVWYKDDENRLVDYGSTMEKMVKLGMRQSLIDSLYELNNNHLNKDTKTIFEELQEKNFTTGSVNLLVYRGNRSHSLSFPPLLNDWLNIYGSLQTMGPDLLAFGTAVKPKVVEEVNLPDGALQRFGLNDEYSIEVVKQLIKKNEQPDFLAVFLPNFDKEAHKHSPHYRVGFERAEHLFAEILNSYESWEQALEENIFIVLGDHGQDKLVADEATMAIDLESIYHDYPIARLGEEIVPGHLVIANNHRMSYILAPTNDEILPILGERAMSDGRINYAAWLEDDWVRVISPDYSQSFRFKPNGNWKDRYNQTWELDGNEEILTLKLDSKKETISYVDFPDILNQLYSALNSHDIPAVVLDAKPGHTFKSEGSPLHVDGGEHGGSHKNDTLASIVIAGTEQKPEHLRIVNLKEFILQLFEETNLK